MASPAFDVIAKRRYHKHRKTKKKPSFGKEALGKGIAPPKISKRLTGGFCFKGAVVTATHSRNFKDKMPDRAIRSRKSSADYDLQCLLRAAKSQGVTDHSLSHSTGMSSAEDIDDPFNPIDHYSEEVDPHVNYKQKPSHQSTSVKEICVNTGTSDETRLPYGNEDQDSDDSVKIKSVPMKKQNNFDHLDKRSHNIPSAKDCTIDLNNLNEKSTILAKSKPHISSYQKFAVGIVEALVSEKKKQFPYLGSLSEQIKRDLDNIYQNTKNIADKTTTKAPSTCSQGYMEVCESEIQHASVPPTRIQQNLERLGCKNVTGQKSFKERTVEAWVEAIPKGLTDISNKRLEEHPKHPKGERTNMQKFEKEFLENVKQKEHTVFKPANLQTLKKDCLPLWIMDDVNSPSFSPVSTKEKNLFLGLRVLPQNEPQEFHRNELVRFNAHKDRTSQNLPKEQQSWASWFKANDKKMEQNQPDSPSYPSPPFPFDPPRYKRGWLATKKEASGSRASMDKKHLEDKSSVWSQFPKLPKKEKKEVSNFQGLDGIEDMITTRNSTEPTFQDYSIPRRYGRSNNNQRSESPAHIQFLPRKMF